MTNWTCIDGELTDGLPIRVYLAADETQVVAAALSDDGHPKSEDEFEWRASIDKGARVSERAALGVLREAATEIREYFSGTRTSFDVPLKLDGSAFQVQVWKQLSRIPFGKVRTYGEIAEAIDHAGAFRAIGNANGRNCIPIFVPCHRVIAAGGKLGGFTGGLGLKKRLLAHEAAVLGSSTGWLASSLNRGKTARQMVAHI